MSDNRIVRNIESVVSECSNHGHGSPEYHPGPTKEYLIAWRTEMWEILRVFDVREFQPIVATVSKSLQGDLGQHMRRSTDAEPPAPASVVVRCVTTSIP